MLKYFFKRQHKSTLIKPGIYLTQITGKYISKLKTLFAETLSRYERKLSLKQKKACFSLITICMAAISTYYLYQGLFTRHAKGPFYLHHYDISTPQDISLPDSLNIELLKQQKLERDKTRHDSIHK